MSALATRVKSKEMTLGEIVRFKIPWKPDWDRANRTLIPSVPSYCKGWRLGLLIEYYTWEKIVTVMYKGDLYRVPASNVQKSGKKDLAY